MAAQVLPWGFLSMAANTCSRVLGFSFVLFERGPEFFALCRLGHLGQGRENFLLHEIDILQRVMEQLVELFWVLSPYSSSFGCAPHARLRAQRAPSLLVPPRPMANDPPSHAVRAPEPALRAGCPMDEMYEDNIKRVWNRKSRRHDVDDAVFPA